MQIFLLFLPNIPTMLIIPTSVNFLNFSLFGINVISSWMSVVILQMCLPQPSKRPSLRWFHISAIYWWMVHSVIHGFALVILPWKIQMHGFINMLNSDSLVNHNPYLLLLLLRRRCRPLQIHMQQSFHSYMIWNWIYIIVILFVSFGYVLFFIFIFIKSIIIIITIIIIRKIVRCSY